MAVLLLGSTAIMAQESKGYALFGAVPEGYEDLTSKVTIEAVGSATFVDGVFTGAGLPGRICESSNYLKMSFTEAQALTLTEDFEVHVVLAKKEAATGDVQVSFCNNGWNAARLGYIIPNASINETATDIVLNYKDYSTDNWNSFGEASFIGAPANFPAAEIFRLCAAVGEQFTIKAIYVTTESAGNTEPEPEVIGYAIFGEVPTGYMDLTSHVSVNGYGTYSDKVSVEEGKIKFTGNTSLSNSRVCADEANNIRLQFTSAQALTLTSNLAIYIKVKKGSANSESNLHFALCKDSWNSNRIGYFIPQAKISNTAEKEIILKYADYSTSDWSSAGSVIGNNVTFGAGDIVRLQAQTDDYFEITQIYIEKTYTPEPAPTIVTAEVDESATEWDKVTLNLKANCARSTVVTYEVTYGSTTKTFTGNAGELTTCVIEGLEGSTEYTFSVVAKNEDGVAADAVTTNLVTTPAKPEGMEIRYYFYRGNNIDPLPNSETLKSVDARPSVYAKIDATNSNSTHNTSYVDYTHFDMYNIWCKMVHKHTSTIENSIDNSYYLVVRFKTDADNPVNNKLSLNLSDGIGQFPINNTETITYNDEKWHIVKFQLKDCKGTLPTAYLQENGVGLQVFVESPGAKIGNYFAIDYAYLTNDATKVDEGTVADIPTGPVSPQDAPGTRYYIVGEGSDATLHKSVDCTITYGNLAHQDTRVSDYYSMKTGNHDWTEITFKSNTTVANTIDAYDSSNWHLVMRFRSSIDNWIFFDKTFQVNLKNQEENFTISSSGYVTYGDGQWHTVKFKLSDADKKTPVQYLQAGQIAAQVYVRSNGNHLQKDEFFDIDYLYFTNDPTEDPNPRTDRKILLHDNRINNANYATLLEKNHGNTVDVDLNRSFVADGAWYTLCLPFSMTADQVNAAFGACKLAKLNSSELRGSSLIHLNFDYVNTIDAGVPYLFMPMADVKPVIIEDVVIDNTLRPIVTDYFSMKGIFYPTHVATGDYFLGTDNYLIAVKDGDSSNLKGLRAYFTIGAGAPASARARVVMAPTVATDLQENTVTTTAEKVIIDGTIYILRGDKIYTTTGQLVK